MPQLAVYGNLIFFIVAYDLSERWHIHVANNKSERKRSAKIWLDTLEVFEQGKLIKQEINIAVNVLEENREKVITAIHNFAQVKKLKRCSYECNAEF